MLKQFLTKNNGTILSLIAGFAAFGAYTSMYAFRKAFAAGSFSGVSFLGLDYKVALVISQVFGYMLSKFIGINLVSSAQHEHRIKLIILLIGFAWLSLLGFGLVPQPFQIIFIFLNGLPLGIIWGLIFSFLEGRKNTELMAAIMASSLIFASGFVKSIGRTLILDYHINEYWMPFLTGLLFILPLLFFLYILSQLPPQLPEDVDARSLRKPMTGAERRLVIAEYGIGLCCIVICYLFLTVVRDMRDNFEVEIWASLGYAKQPAIFTQIDLPVALIVLAIIASLVKVKNNWKAFIILHYIILSGLFLAGMGGILFNLGYINPIIFMTLTALGLYMAYVPCNSILFERMISAFKITGNVGFVMYIADAVGYLGSVGVLLSKQFGNKNISWLHFFSHSLLVLGSIGMIFIAISLGYFIKKYKIIDLNNK